MRAQPALALVGAAVLLAACRAERRPAGELPTHTTSLVGESRYHLDGRVVQVDLPGHILVVDHQPIAGYMGAMTMPYRVRDSVVLRTLTPGDRIGADVVVRRDSVWLDHLVIYHAP